MNENENKTMLNVNKSISQLPAAGTEMEEQFAQAVVELLDDRAQHVGVDVAKRLSTARNLAVSQLTERQTQLVVQHDAQQNGNVLQWLGSNLGQYFGHHRMMSLTLLLIVTLFAFFAVQQLGMNSNLEHGDAFLLASDLPPEAYVDKGFDTWLDTTTD